MNEPGALDERLRTLVMQSLEGGGERLRLTQERAIWSLTATEDNLEACGAGIYFYLSGKSSFSEGQEIFKCC